MKKSSSSVMAFLLAVILLPSCNKERLVLPEPPTIGENEGVVLVSLFDAAAATRSSVALSTYEDAIHCAQIFVFSHGENTVLNKSDGQLETDKYFTVTASGSTSTTLTVTTGPKRIWAVVNYPQRIDDVTTEAELKAKTSNLSENVFAASSSGGGLVMAGAYGYTSGNNAISITPGNVTVNKYSVGASAQDIAIPGYRLGASIQLSKVTVNFTNTSLSGKEFRIKEVYLKNVVNKVRLDGTNGDGAAITSQANWSNQVYYNSNLGHDWNQDAAGSVASLLYEGLEVYEASGQACNVAGTATTVIGGKFYVYPNANTVDNTGGKAWSSGKRTRMVIHATVGGADSYYVLSIADPANYTPGLNETEKFPSIVGNRIYTVNNVNITSIGKPDDLDDDVTETGLISANITVSDWAGTTLLEYNL